MEQKHLHMTPHVLHSNLIAKFCKLFSSQLVCKVCNRTINKWLLNNIVIWTIQKRMETEIVHFMSEIGNLIYSNVSTFIWHYLLLIDGNSNKERGNYIAFNKGLRLLSTVYPRVITIFQSIK